MANKELIAMARRTRSVMKHSGDLKPQEIIDALADALEAADKAEQTPVAWLRPTSNEVDDPPHYEEAPVGAAKAFPVYAHPAPPALAPDDGFKPCIQINEELGITEIVFEDTGYIAKPVFDGVYHWIDKHEAMDDGRLVGMAVWLTKPKAARAPDVLEEVRTCLLAFAHIADQLQTACPRELLNGDEIIIHSPKGDPIPRVAYARFRAARALLEKLTPDPRDPRPGAEGIFRDHNCAVCGSGARPCTEGNAATCSNPHARND